MIQQGEINIILDNVSEAETLRLRAFIHTLIANGSLNLRNGRVIIHIDSSGLPQKIEQEFIKWSKKHNPT